jgi:hypothetical protein
MLLNKNKMIYNQTKSPGMVPHSEDRKTTILNSLRLNQAPKTDFFFINQFDSTKLASKTGKYTIRGTRWKMDVK